MTYAKLKKLAEDMSPEEVQASLRSLVNDNRFAGVLHLILQQKETASDSSCQLKFAEHHGCLAHAAGVRYAMLELESKIKELSDPPKRRGAQAPTQKQ